MNATMHPPLSDRFTALLAPVSDTAPGGPDLEYDAGFLQLMQAAQPRSEQQYGDTIIPAQQPEWREVAVQAEALLARSKDLRVAVLLGQAWTELHGLAGYADGLQLVAGLLAQFGPVLHPALEEDGVTDPLPRHNALAGLVDPQQGLRALRAAPLAATGLAWRDAEPVLDGAADVFPGGSDRLRGELTRAWAGGDPSLRALPAAIAALDAITAHCEETLGIAWVPDTAGARRVLQRVLDICQPSLERAPATLDAATPVAAAPLVQSGVDWRALELASREDVHLLLDKICHYLERHEPSHPAPILLRRAQRLMQLGFYDIVRDLAPDSLGQIDLLIGRSNG